MAFVPGNLAVLSYAAGFSLWCYSSVDDPLDSILAPGYFDAAFTHLRRDDLVLLNGRNGARLGLVTASGPAGVAVDPLGDVPDRAPPPIPRDAILDEEGSPILDEAGRMILAG